MSVPITVTARGFYSQSGEMYQITFDLEQKPAVLGHFFFKENNNIPCTLHLEELCDISPTVILTLEFSFFQISSLYGTDAYIIDITANQMICIG